MVHMITQEVLCGMVARTTIKQAFAALPTEMKAQKCITFGLIIAITTLWHLE